MNGSRNDSKMSLTGACPSCGPVSTPGRPSCTKQICQMQKRHLIYRNRKHRAGKHLCSVCLFIHTEALNAYCVDGVSPPMAYGVNYVGVCEFDRRYEFINGSLLL